jgi:para-nitrobenzyl esterase
MAVAGLGASTEKCSSPLPDTKQPLLEIATGRLRGFQRAGIRAFKGVPYGAPTGGDNRFLPPQPCEPWSGVREALNYGPQCPFARI